MPEETRAISAQHRRVVTTDMFTSDDRAMEVPSEKIAVPSSASLPSSSCGNRSNGGCRLKRG
jgi:hypothetical protein